MWAVGRVARPAGGRTTVGGFRSSIHRWRQPQPDRWRRASASLSPAKSCFGPARDVAVVRQRPRTGARTLRGPRGRVLPEREDRSCAVEAMWPRRSRRRVRSR
ncbi:hypothetical protein ZWY2020_030591 [Hordeum vulgare]|nr:hypothetical protein ZWY2020_030591 [Hordeum vulgare]